MMNKLIKKLSKNIKYAEDNNYNLNDVSWGMQEGCLISYNDAKFIVKKLNTSKAIELNKFLEYCDNAGWIKGIERQRIVDDYLKATKDESL